MDDSANGARVAPVDPAVQTLDTEEAAVAPIRWYALHVRSRHERVVESSLTEKGYGVLFPFYRAKRKRIDRIVEIDLPLFPGYMFCSLDVTKLLPVLKTPGVAQLQTEISERGTRQSSRPSAARNAVRKPSSLLSD